MSLINEALKKAQRLRHEQQAGASAEGAEPTSGIRKRGRPLSAQTLLILVAAASVLIVFSVVITVYLLNQEPPPPPAPAVVTKPAPAIDTNAPSPVIVAPVIANQTASAAAAPAPVTAGIAVDAPPAVALPAPKEPATATAPAVTGPPTAAPGPAPAITAAAEAPKPAPPIQPVAPKPDPRIQDFVDAVRVAGIRSSGTDSKVLMNDRVYKVNDIVDRNLGVKLVKVAPDALVFADANGFTYTKNF